MEFLTFFLFYIIVTVTNYKYTKPTLGLSVIYFSSNHVLNKENINNTDKYNM